MMADSCLDAWKRDLTFTGDRLVFPAEMFVMLMETKFGNLGILEDTSLVKAALQHIPDASGDNDGDAGNRTTAGKWKKEKNFLDGNVDWSSFKILLLKQFGQKRCYNTFERLQFLQSSKRGPGETFSMFITRLSVIVSFLEFGRLVCDKSPSSEMWIKLLMLLGLKNEENVFTREELDKMTLDQLSFAVSNVKSERNYINHNHRSILITETKKNEVLNIKVVDFLYDQTLNIPDDEFESGNPDKKFVRTKKLRKAKRKALLSQTNTDNRVQCLICEVSLESFESVSKHELKVHEEGLNCEVCKLSFSSHSEVMEHQKYSHDGTKYECKICSAPQPNLSSLKIHTVEQHGTNSKINKLHTSQNIIKTNPEKSNHNVENSIDNKVKDDPDFSLFSTLKYNISEEEESKFSCSFCNETFKSKKEILSHVQEKHNNFRFKCDSCDFKGKKQRDIARHRLAKHGVETEGYDSYACTYDNCTVKMSCKIKLEQHLRVHDNLRPFVCGVCDKAFQFKGSLKVHTETVHMKLKVHKCDKCEKAFSALSGLTYHKAVKHDIGQKEKHACEICGETTYYKATLQKHIEIKHTDRTKIHCPHCNNLFISQLTLDRHIKTQHDKDTQYACPHCTKLFGTSYKQKVHIKTAHQNFRPFRCKLCKAVFTEGNNLSVHIASVHDHVPLKIARKSSAAYRKHSAFERLVEGSLSVMEDDDVLIHSYIKVQRHLDDSK